MTRRASISQADLKRMAAVAVEFGVCVEADIQGMTVRVMPSGTHRAIRHELTKEDEGQKAWDEWDAARAKRKPKDELSFSTISNQSVARPLCCCRESIFPTPCTVRFSLELIALAAVNNRGADYGMREV